jgi:hypothetical protein
MSKEPGHEFRVVLEGIELPPEAVERLNRAIQKAAVMELVHLDLSGEFSIDLPTIRVPGTTMGLIWRQRSQ